jgi:hypothetical protein
VRAARRVLPALLLLTACAGQRTAPNSAIPPDDTERLVRLAETRAQAGAHTEAVVLFEEAARGPGSPFVDRALIGLTRSLCNPDYLGRDLRQAYVVADRLVRDYPNSPHAAEARAWRDLLLAYLVRGRELDRRTMELERQTLELERLRGVERALERRTRDLQQRTQELERLRSADLELERRTRELQRQVRELERLKQLDLDLEQRTRRP